MITINILTDSKFPVERAFLREHLTRVLTKYRLTQNVEMTVSLVGKRKMTELHLTYMNLPGPTNVLSFPLTDPDEKTGFVASPDGVLRLGDVVICYPLAVEEALAKQSKLDEQIAFLSEHGLMHLLGFHHE